MPVAPSPLSALLTTPPAAALPLTRRAFVAGAASAAVAVALGGCSVEQPLEPADDVPADEEGPLPTV